MLVSPVTGMLRISAPRILWRTMFTSRPHDFLKPKWFSVTLAFGTSVVLWGLLIKQHNEDVAEYKKRNGLE